MITELQEMMLQVQLKALSENTYCIYTGFYSTLYLYLSYYRNVQYKWFYHFYQPVPNTAGDATLISMVSLYHNQ